MIRITLRSAAVAALTALAAVAAIVVADFSWTAQAQDGGASEVEGRIVVRPWVDDDGELTRVEFGFRPGWGEDVRGGGDGPDDLFPPKRFLTQRLIDGSAGRWLRSSEILLPNAEGSEEGVRGRIIARAEVDDDGELSRIGFGFRPGWGEDVRGEESGADDIFPTNRFLTRRLIDNSAGKWLRSSLISVPAERPEENTEPSEGEANETGEVGADGGSATAADGATIVVPAGAAEIGAEITVRILDPAEHIESLPEGVEEDGLAGGWDFHVNSELTAPVTIRLPVPDEHESRPWFLAHYTDGEWYAEPFAIEDGAVVAQFDSLSEIRLFYGVPFFGPTIATIFVCDDISGGKCSQKIERVVDQTLDKIWEGITFTANWAAEFAGLKDPIVCNNPDDSVTVNNPSGGDLVDRIVGVYLKGCAQATADGTLLTLRNPRHIWFDVRPIRGPAEYAQGNEIYNWLSAHDEGTLLGPGATADWRPTRDGVVTMNADFSWTAAGVTVLYPVFVKLLAKIVPEAVVGEVVTRVVRQIIENAGALQEALNQFRRGNGEAAFKTLAEVIAGSAMRQALIDGLVKAGKQLNLAGVLTNTAISAAFAKLDIALKIAGFVRSGAEALKVLVRNDEDRFGTVAFTVPRSVCWGGDITEGTVSGRWNHACQSQRLDGSYARYHRFVLDEAQEVILALDSSRRFAVYVSPGTTRTTRPVITTTDLSDSVRRELEAGVYTIEVVARGARQTGMFDLRVELTGAQDDEPDEGDEQPAADESRFIAVSAGEFHTCGLRETGAVECWGWNSHGQTDAPAGRFSAVSAGRLYSCGLRETGAVECWGNNGAGETDAPAGRFSALSAGVWHTCGLRETGAVECWGDNEYGQTNAPAGRFSALSARWLHTCGLRESGAVECWGRNNYGETDAPAGNFSALNAGGHHSCGLRESGAVECWGWNSYGQTNAPAGRFSAVSAGGLYSCGLRETGAVECWGDNRNGQTDAPAGNFSALSAGVWHTCGLRETGAVECWGQNEHGQTDAPDIATTAIVNANEPPRCDRIADVGPLSPGEAGGRIRLSDYCRDPENEPLRYEPTSSDSGIATTFISGDSLIVAAARTGGTATITLTATDPGGLTARTSFRVTVRAPDPDPPDITISCPAYAETGRSFSCTVRNRGGAATSWNWSASGGTAGGRSETYSATFTSFGRHIVRLTASNAGGSDSDSTTVRLVAGPPSSQYSRCGTDAIKVYWFDRANFRKHHVDMTGEEATRILGASWWAKIGHLSQPACDSWPTGGPRTAEDYR